MAFRSEPFAPITIALCDSLSTWMARSIFGIFPLSSNRSTMTATPCGTSSRVFRRICSRTNSATKKRIGLSVISSLSKSGGPSGRRSFTSLMRSRTPTPRMALIGTSAANSRKAACPFRIGSRADFGFTLSILLMQRMTGLSAGMVARILASASRIVSLSSLETDVRKTTTSASRAPSRASWFIRAPSLVRAWCTPGVSTNTSCASPSVSTPTMRSRVVCGWRLVIAMGSPSSAFKSVLLPTLARPMMATRPERRMPWDSDEVGGSALRGAFEGFTKGATGRGHAAGRVV